MEVFCAKEAEQGDRAAKYWHHTTAKQQAEASLILLATEWSRLASNNPFSEAWRNTTGSKFDRLISRLSANPSMRTASAVKSVLIDGVLRTMTDPWLEAKKLQEIVVILREEAQSIPTSGELLGRWWNERPVEALVLDSVPGDWSEIPDTFEVLNRLSDWLNQWNDLVDAERPAAEQEAQLLRDRTISRLELAANLLPDPNNQIHAIDIIRKLENDPYSEWPITEISKSILRFGAERMRAQASGLQAKIKVSTFKMAKSAWIERLRTDDEAVRSVDRLETMLTRNFGRLPAGNTQVFRAALRIAPIWITTAQAPQAVPLEPDLFDIVVIDEASQCTVTNLLPLLYRGKSLVVIGDDQQLPSITTVNEAEEMSLARKYRVEDFLYLIGHDKNDVYRAAVNSLPGRRGDVSMLVEHYRSHPQIIGFSNRYIYNQQLELKKDPNRIKQSTIAGGIHKRSVQGVARKGNNGQSWVNEPEADMVIRLIHEIKAGDSRSLSLGVVTPFAAHKKYLLDKLKNADFASDVLIDSAYGFQGDEKDIIIFSPVVASGITPLASRWVEEPPNLINVAITRARESVFVVADFNYCLSQNGLLRKLALYCNDIQTLRDTSQAELELYSWMILKGINPKVHPRIGDIEVDFSLKSTSGQNLVVEVDGKQHLNAIEGDKVRDAFLSTQGYSVLRFPVRDVFETPIAVLHTIQEHLNN